MSEVNTMNAASLSGAEANVNTASGLKIGRTTMSSSSFDVAVIDVNGIYTGMNQVEPHRAIDDEHLKPTHDKTKTAGVDVNTDDSQPNPTGNDKSNEVMSVLSDEERPASSVKSKSKTLEPVGAGSQVILNGVGPASVAKNELFMASSSQTKSYSIEYAFKKIKPAYLIDSNGFLDYVKLFILFFLNLFVFLPMVVLIFLVFTPYKFILRLFYKILHMCHLTRTSYISPDKIPEFLNGIELFWLYNSGHHETSPDESANFLSKSACLFLLDGCLSKNKVRDIVKNRIIESNIHSKKFERFTQRIMNLRSLGFAWVPCTTFDIEEHIVEIDSGLNFESSDQIQSYLANVVGRHKFDLSKPLWSLYYKQTVNSKTERSTMVLFVFHQSFSDGVSLIRLFFRGLVDNRNQLEIRPRFAYSVLRRTQLKQLLFGWSSLFYKMFFRKRVAKNEMPHLRRSSTQTTPPSSTSGQSGVLVWSDAYDLMHLNRLKLITRSKMNDFLVSVVGGIIRKYLQNKGINSPNNLSCLMPIDLHSNKYPMKLNGRKSALSSFELPLKTEGCVPRLWATKCTTQSLKRSSDFLLLHFLIKVMFKIFPNKFAYARIRSIINENSCLVSTLGCGDSSLATVSVANQAVKNLIYFSPTVANVAISFSVITYGDEVRLAMVADPGVISNPEFITSEFIKQLTVLSDLLSNRRIPGEIKKGGRQPVDFDQLYSHPLIEANQMDDYAVNDAKIAQIQQELQQLTESMENLNTSSPDYNKKRQVILIKSDKLRKEFSRMLNEMRSRSSQISQAIPSDDEDELEPEERIRLRSASVASRMSGNSHSRRFLRDSLSEHSNVERPMSSRKASLAQNSRHGSLSYSSGRSLSREFQASHGNSNLNLHTLHNHTGVSTENELTRVSRRSADHS